jgi:indolepyruvate ferredoxin oxidoreductase
MAIKDEYEVARLYSSKAFKEELAEQFSGDWNLRFHLAPPILSPRDSRTGKQRKREFGSWILPAFHILASLRFLRGTPIDVFGMTKERRQEREDLNRYQDHIALVQKQLTPSNYQVAKALLGLSAQLRGFGHVKNKNRKTVAVQEVPLIASLQAPEEVVRVMEPTPI